MTDKPSPARLMTPLDSVIHVTTPDGTLQVVTLRALYVDLYRGVKAQLEADAQKVKAGDVKISDVKRKKGRGK